MLYASSCKEMRDVYVCGLLNDDADLWIYEFNRVVYAIVRLYIELDIQIKRIFEEKKNQALQPNVEMKDCVLFYNAWFHSLASIGIR